MQTTNTDWLFKADGSIERCESKYETPAASASVTSLVVDSDYDLADMEESISHIAQITIRFLSSADGRGFSLARSLRGSTRLANGFAGRLLATGAIIPDQATLAFQCGFDGLLVSQARVDQYQLSAWRSALKPTVAASYAPSLNTTLQSIWQQRLNAQNPIASV